MKISFSLSFDFVLSRDHGSVYHRALGGGMAREEFIEKVRDSLKAQKESQERGQQMKLHDAEVIKADGSKKWSAIKGEMNSIVMAISGPNGEEISYTPEDTNRVKVTNKLRNASVGIVFDPAKAWLTYSGSGVPGGFVSKINGNELVFTFDVARFPQGIPQSQYGREFTPEEIAEKIFTAVIGI